MNYQEIERRMRQEAERRAQNPVQKSLRDANGAARQPLPSQEDVNEDFFRRGKEEWQQMGGFPKPRLQPEQGHGAPALTPAPVVDWRTLLATSGKDYLGDERNVLIALRNAPELVDLVRFNEFALQIEFQRSPPWRDVERGAVWAEADDTQCTVWLQQVGLKLRGARAVASCIEVAARDNGYHPVRQYLESITWDGAARAKTWLAKYLNGSGGPEYLAAVGTRFLVSAVARALQPGCQADHVLVLEAPQGAGKTSAARALATRPEWFAGDLPDIHSKDARLQLVGHWIVEIAELRAVRSSELEAQKSFITQTHDTFRPPYGRRTAQFPRQSVFIATTNETEYLRDRTGNRRYWPVRCGRIDRDAIKRDRDQLWAEAVHVYRKGVPWHLTDAETLLANREQQGRVHVTELEQDVAAYLDTVTADEITVREVLIHGMRLDPHTPSYSETARKLGALVADAMDRCGWQKDARRGKDRRTTYRRRQE